jgi:hypothetical protein
MEDSRSEAEVSGFKVNLSDNPFPEIEQARDRPSARPRPTKRSLSDSINHHYNARAHKKARTVRPEPVANVSPTLADVRKSSKSALFYDVDTWLSDHAHRHFIGHEDSHSPTQDASNVSPIDMVEGSTHNPALEGDSAESHLQNQNALEIDLAGVGAFTLDENA